MSQAPFRIAPAHRSVRRVRGSALGGARAGDPRRRARRIQCSQRRRGTRKDGPMLRRDCTTGSSQPVTPPRFSNTHRTLWCRRTGLVASRRQRWLEAFTHHPRIGADPESSARSLRRRRGRASNGRRAWSDRGRDSKAGGAEQSLRGTLRLSSSFAPQEKARPRCSRSWSAACRTRSATKPLCRWRAGEDHPAAPRKTLDVAVDVERRIEPRPSYRPSQALRNRRSA